MISPSRSTEALAIYSSDASMFSQETSVIMAMMVEVEQRMLTKRPTVPRISAGAIWSAIGFAWLLAAVFDEASTIRFVLGGLWLVTGVVMLVVAVRDRRRGRGYYAPRSVMASTSPED